MTLAFSQTVGVHSYRLDVMDMDKDMDTYLQVQEKRDMDFFNFRNDRNTSDCS